MTPSVILHSAFERKYHGENREEKTREEKGFE
jgi:hypothetical protein